MAPFRVIMLPGSVLPAELAYGSLVEALGSDADVVAKELEMYATDEAPRDYTLDLEVAGVFLKPRFSRVQRLQVTGPVTSSTSAWRGEATNFKPKRSTS